MFKSIKLWIKATRAETTVVSLSSIIIGICLASKEVRINCFFLLLTILYGIFLHLATNLSNDYFDYIKGVDTEERIAPYSTIQTHETSLKQVRRAFSIFYLLAFFLGLILITKGGVLAAILFTFPIIFSYYYTAGPKPLGYLGYGELLVLIFFGPFACFGTYYLQTLKLSILPIIASLGPGCLSVAVLIVNNLRDINIDRKAQKITLAVRLGKNVTKLEYLISLFIAFLVPFIYFSLLKKPIFLAASGFILFAPIKLIFNFKDPKLLNNGLKKTVLLLIIYTVIFCFAIEMS
jgi:1,4-dihydroxy-2-naphthoate polyprenyltransferase